MKKLTLRTVGLAVAILVLLGGIALAAIQLGQEYYFNTRYTNFKDHSPQAYQAIMDNLQSEIPQQVEGPAAELVDIRVQDAAWSEEAKVVTFSIASSPRDGAKYELHDELSMDTDGALVGEIDPEEPESRLHHWLWTEKGFGLPKDVMLDPEKQLLLVNQWSNIYIGDTDVGLPQDSGDMYTTPDGPVLAVFHFDLNKLDDSFVRGRFNYDKVPEGITKEDWHRTLDDSMARMLAEGKAMREAIPANTDAEGYLSLRFPFHVKTFADDTYGEEIPGVLRFRIKIK